VCTKMTKQGTKMKKKTKQNKTSPVRGPSQSSPCCCVPPSLPMHTIYQTPHNTNHQAPLTKPPGTPKCTTCRESHTLPQILSQAPALQTGPPRTGPHAYHQSGCVPHTLSEWSTAWVLNSHLPVCRHAKPGATAALVPSLVVTTCVPLAPTSQTNGGWARQDNPQPPHRTTC
jgi:hypothetical protein